MLLNTEPEFCLSAFQVLNVGHAKLTGKVKVGALTSLGALILNDNALTSISGNTCTALQQCDLAAMTKNAELRRSTVLNLLCMLQEGMAECKLARDSTARGICRLEGDQGLEHPGAEEQCFH